MLRASQREAFTARAAGGDSREADRRRGSALKPACGKTALLKFFATSWSMQRKRRSAVTSADHQFPIWTVGHSTRTFAEFLSLLQSCAIECIADVRRFPGSRKYPHFNAESLKTSLNENAIAYEWFQELGGRRKPDPHSHNTAWRNASFRAYADYMETDDFRNGLERLLRLARAKRTAIMCSEAVWWRCHRSLVADALKISGVKVFHILERGKVVEHPFTSVAQIVDGRLEYGAAQGTLL
jgi:hypothetical protein